MKVSKKLKWAALLPLCILVIFMVAGCDDDPPTSDEKQQTQQEQMLQEGTSETGMPAIKNFRERKLLKDIYELRDQNGLVTYTYLENQMPQVVHGKTALGGKLTFLGNSIGYGIPCATQYTNPMKTVEGKYTQEFTAIPQADPNGLFSPGSAEGTWVMMQAPGKQDAEPQYVEPRVCVFTYKLPFD